MACFQLCLSNTKAHAAVSDMLKRRSCLPIASDRLYWRCQPLPVYQILVLRVTPTVTDQTTPQKMVLDNRLRRSLYTRQMLHSRDYRPDKSQAAALLYE